ncbi:hypothetical protein KPK_5243 [Klebsiella variicola]|uniref:Uncharacterized protein n=1 Tax=Klebsiella variicola (strain 342) TaxID=507522 RepID=B5XXY7_KLEV3|nr:hypothetical protein KPK_5243 [Klebsiella variicola]
MPFITAIYEFPRLRAAYRGNSVARLSVAQAGKIASALPIGMMVKNSE